MFFIDYIRLKYFTNPEKIKKHSYEGLKKLCYISEVYDGDTVTLVFIHNSQKVKLSCRLYGIDTPEIRTKNLDEKKDAFKAKYYLSDLVLNKIKYVEMLKFDKYGRLLINIYHKNKRRTSINRLMIDNNYAKSYFGGTKELFAKQSRGYLLC